MRGTNDSTYRQYQQVTAFSDTNHTLRSTPVSLGDITSVMNKLSTEDDDDDENDDDSGGNDGGGWCWWMTILGWVYIAT
jgi:hypothetical protein